MSKTKVSIARSSLQAAKVIKGFHKNFHFQQGFKVKTAVSHKFSNQTNKISKKDKFKTLKISLEKEQMSTMMKQMI